MKPIDHGESVCNNKKNRVMPDSDNDSEFRENPYRHQLPSNTAETGFRQYGSAIPTGSTETDPMHPGSDAYLANAQMPVDNQMPAEPPPKTTVGGIIVSFVCWGLFLAISTFIAISYHVRIPAAGEVSPRAELFRLTFGAKLMVGAKTIVQGDSVPNDDFEGNDMPIGSVRNLQASSVLVAEMNSLDAASDLLDRLESQATLEEYGFSEDEQRVTKALRQIYEGVELAEISQPDRELLKNELAWFGTLALNLQRKKNETPSAERTELLANARAKLVTLVVAILIGVLAFVGGLIGLITFAIFYVTRKLHIRLEQYTQHSTIYIEAATGWLLAYFASGFAIGKLVPFSNPLVMSIAVSAISFSFAILWPSIRGVHFGDFLKDIGFAGNLFVEAAMGLVSYIACLPILAVGYATTMIALSIAGPTLQDGTLSSPSGPGHPMVEWISDGGITTIVLVFFVACVCAPIVEETIFRGLMYRNLRDNTFRAGHFVSVMLSALVNGFIFAIIHPQGIFLIPMLGALAFAFSIAREWRGSLIAPMTMHAIHNALVTSFLLFIMMD